MDILEWRGLQRHLGSHNNEHPMQKKKKKEKDYILPKFNVVAVKYSV